MEEPCLTIHSNRRRFETGPNLYVAAACGTYLPCSDMPEAGI